MAKTHMEPMPISGRPADHSDGGGRVWKWVFLSGFAHVILIAALLIMPFLPSKAPNYPVYSVDLVGGEKIGGGAGTSVAPAPKLKPVPEVKAAPEVKETRKEPKAKKTKEEPPARTQLAKESAKKAADKRATEMAELAAAKAKKEAEEAEAEKTRERLKQLREKRIEEALADVKNRAQREEKAQQQQQQQKAAAAKSTVTGDQPGAAAPGVGGMGGGVVKGIEFTRYYNDIQRRVKGSWAWVGKRTDLKVTARVRIQDTGEITGWKLIGSSGASSSGDAAFDESVVRAIRKANPLPPPPENYRRDFSEVDFDFDSKEQHLGG